MAGTLASGVLIAPPLAVPVLATPGELLEEWTFQNDLDGWKADGVGPRGPGEWGVAVWFDRDGGVARLSGVGGTGRRNSAISLQLAIPADAGVLTFRASADDDHEFADSRLRVRILSDGAATTIHDAIYSNTTSELAWNDVELDIAAYAGTEVVLVFEQDDDGDGEHEHIYLDDIRLYTAGCSLGGTILVNDPAVDPAAPGMPDVRVELWKGDAVEAGPVPTDRTGAYCLHAPEPEDAAEYRIRATLEDARHDPPIFSTRDGADPAGRSGPTFFDTPVGKDQWGDQAIALDFGSTLARPTLADVARIHYESWRFVDWLIGNLGLSPGELGTFRIEAYANGGTRYHYTAPPLEVAGAQGAAVVYIDARDSSLAARATALSNCPENCEWHEIGHHVGRRLGIAPTDAGACAGRGNHEGWKNATTCDSLLEGLPMFLATTASLDLDAGRAGGYATAAYAGFGSLENNGWRPWSYETSGNGAVLEREDLAVAQLLWDLADETPQETARYGLDDPRFPPDATMVLHDQVALGAAGLIAVLRAAQTDTVADVRDALLADPDVPPATRRVHPDTAPVSATMTLIEEAFVLHGFHPVDTRYPQVDDVRPAGGSLGRTDRPANLAPGAAIETRRDTEPLPGSAIRLRNPGSRDLTFSIDVTYPDDTSHAEITVPAAGDLVVHLEVPPPWAGRLEEGTALPDCASAALRLTTIAISAPGTLARTLDSCEYLHAVAATTDDAAVTYEAGTAIAPPGATAPVSSSGPAGPVAQEDAPGAVLVVAIAIALISVVAGGAWFARRRSAPGSSDG